MHRAVRRVPLSLMLYHLDGQVKPPTANRRSIPFDERWPHIERVLQDAKGRVDFVGVVGADDIAIQRLRGLGWMSVVDDDGRSEEGLPNVGSALTLGSRGVGSWTALFRQESSPWTASVDVQTTPLTVDLRHAESATAAGSAGMRYRLAITDWNDFSTVFVPTFTAPTSSSTMDPSATMPTCGGHYATPSEARAEAFRVLSNSRLDFLLCMSHMSSGESGTSGFRDAGREHKGATSSTGEYLTMDCTDGNSAYFGSSSVVSSESSTAGVEGGGLGDDSESTGSRPTPYGGKNRYIRCFYRRGIKQVDGSYTVLSKSCKSVRHSMGPHLEPTLHRPIIATFDVAV